MRSRRTAVTAALIAAVLVAGAACSSDSGGPDGGSSPTGDRSAPASPASPPTGSPGAASDRVTVSGTVTEGLDTPWGLAFLPGGGALVASRDTGRVTLVPPDGRRREVGRVPGVSAAGEGGLLGLAVPPTYGGDHFVYAYLTADRDNRIVRMTFDGARFGTPSVVLDGIPKGGIHNGGRIAFGPDGMLYAGTGESGRTGLSQDVDSLGGKILRMKPEGGSAPGNPFPRSVVYSYGHRNVQGLAWDDEGRLWASEFGQNTWDELNLIKPGANYGWPEVEGKSDAKGSVNPVAQWRTDEASPSGIAFAEGAIWMAGLRGERLWRIPLRGTPRAFLTGRYGRLRTVERAPDGSLWLTTSNTDGRGRVRPGDDRVLRLTVG